MTNITGNCNDDKKGSPVFTKDKHADPRLMPLLCSQSGAQLIRVGTSRFLCKHKPVRPTLMAELLLKMLKKLKKLLTGVE